MLFGQPCGTVEQSGLADLVVYDAVPSPDSDGFSPGLLWSLPQAPVAWTVVGGRVVVREGRLLGADFIELAHEAARALEAIRARA
jgi:hypothetical protein